MRIAWPFTFYFLQYAAIASVSPFMVLYYQSLGFTGAQIGLIMGITPLVTFVSAPLWTAAADVTRRHRLAMGLALLLGAITLLVYPLLRAFAPVFGLAILLSAFLSPVTSFADSATMFMLADRKDMYGRVRLGGTVGFGLVAPIAGVFIENLGLKFAFWACVVFCLLEATVSQKLVFGHVQTDSSSRGDVRSLLTNARWLLFLALAFAGGMALAATNNYFFPYMKELGAQESMMGLSLTVGTISEIPVLFFGNRLIKLLKSYGLLVFAMAITGLRLLLFGVCGTVALALLIQLFGGLTFAAMWMAGVSYADENAPRGMSATAQGLFGAMVFGFGMAVGGFIGGPLLESVGGRGLYLVFGVIVLAITMSVAVAYRRLPARQEAQLIP